MGVNVEKDIKIKKVDTVEECLVCNKMLEDLIKFESKFDQQINENHKISDHYERTLNKEDSVIFLAKVNDSIVGYIMAYKAKEKLSVKDNIINIMNIYVCEEHRNKKIGKRLISEVENWAKTQFENFVIELDCISKNENAIAFYKSLGFNPVRVKMRKQIK